MALLAKKPVEKDTITPIVVITKATDPVTALVMQSSLADVDSVMVAGRWRKRDGLLLDASMSRILDELDTSGARIVRALGPPSLR